MRSNSLCLAAAVFLLGAAPAAVADFTVDLLWDGTSNSTSASPGDTLTLELFLSIDDESTMLTAYQFSLIWDSTELSMVPGTLNNSGPSGQLDWTNGGAGEALLDNEVGELLAPISSGTIAFPLDSIVAAEGPIFIGSLQFQVGTPMTDGKIDINACVNCGSMYVGDGSAYTNSDQTEFWSSFDGGTFNGAILNNPEPSTASLLGLGLVALAAARRRKRSGR